MSIQPTVVIHMEKVTGVDQERAQPITNPPRVTTANTIDAGYIDKIQNQPLPNEIEQHTSSPLKTDIEQMIGLIGAYCEPNSVTELNSMIQEIHDTLNDKEPPDVKGWIRLLTSVHPKVDTSTKQLEYWKNLYSEVMGTNTVTYAADESDIDVTAWAKSPLNHVKSDRMIWFVYMWPSPTYLRESVRQKIEPDAVEYIQNAGHAATKLFRKNIIFDAFKTTEDGTGKEVPQERPIPYKTAHGVSLNNDWYHQKYRIMEGTLNKHWGKHDVIYKLDSGGFKVHVLVNHLNPLLYALKAPDYTYTFKKPLGVETDTFPNKDSSLTMEANHDGDKVLDVPTEVNDKPLEPEIIDYEDT